jgi:polysaccharide export outer membrane protein
LAVLLCIGVPGVARVHAQTSSATSDREQPALMPGDMVRLKIWREPDLSGDYTVNEDSIAVFPKIGPLHVGALTPDSLKAQLLTGYARYLQDPAVEVTFLRRVNVLGAVKNPGLYHVDPTMTLADVVAMAGGVSSDGNSKQIELLRRGKPVATMVSLQSPVAELPLQSGDELRVPQRSWLSRNAEIVAAGITGVALVATAVLRP